VQGRGWRAQAERQQTTDKVVPARRGDILDVSRRVLAQSHEVVRVEIAPREVNERKKLKTALNKLRVEPSVIAKALDTTNKYLVVPGRFRTSDAAQLVGGLPGLLAPTAADIDTELVGARGQPTFQGTHH